MLHDDTCTMTGYASIRLSTPLFIISFATEKEICFSLDFNSPRLSSRHIKQKGQRESKKKSNHSSIREQNTNFNLFIGSVCTFWSVCVQLLFQTLTMTAILNHLLHSVRSCSISCTLLSHSHPWKLLKIFGCGAKHSCGTALSWQWFQLMKWRKSTF